MPYRVHKATVITVAFLFDINLSVGRPDKVSGQGPPKSRTVYSRAAFSINNYIVCLPASRSLGIFVAALRSGFCSLFSKSALSPHHPAIALFYLFKIDIIIRVFAGNRLRVLYRRRFLAGLLVHFFLHLLMHGTKLLLHFTGGFIHRYYKTENKVI